MRDNVEHLTPLGAISSNLRCSLYGAAKPHAMGRVVASVTGPLADIWTYDYPAEQLDRVNCNYSEYWTPEWDKFAIAMWGRGKWSIFTNDTYPNSNRPIGAWGFLGGGLLTCTIPAYPFVLNQHIETYEVRSKYKVFGPTWGVVAHYLPGDVMVDCPRSATDNIYGVSPVDQDSLEAIEWEAFGEFIRARPPVYAYAVSVAEGESFEFAPTLEPGIMVYPYAQCSLAMFLPGVRLTELPTADRPTIDTDTTPIDEDTEHL